MMHGFPDNQHLYDLVIPILASTRHVITFDFLGWGESDKPSDHRHDVSSLRNDLEAVVSALNLRSVVVVIHDLSGQPGIDWALDNEDRVAALVLLNTYYSSMAGLKPPEAIARFSTPGLRRDLSVWGAGHSDAMWQRGVDDQISKFFASQSAREAFVPIFVHQALGIRPAFFGHNAGIRKEIARRDPLGPRLVNFHSPVRIVFGADDPYPNSSVANEFQQLCPGSELFLIANAAHYVQLDQPLRVAELILTSGSPSVN
jgi:haloalkane dehalogenase